MGKRRLLRQLPEHRAENVGAVRQVARPESVADLLGGDGGHQPEARSKLRSDGRTRRGDELMRLIDLAERDALEDLQSRRRGHWEGAVRAFHRAMAVVQAAAEDLFYPEGFEAHAGEDDIGDAVECADLVEMDGFRSLAMDLPLGYGDAVKDADGVLLHES